MNRMARAQSEKAPCNPLPVEGCRSGRVCCRLELYRWKWGALSATKRDAGNASQSDGRGSSPVPPLHLHEVATPLTPPPPRWLDGPRATRSIRHLGAGLGNNLDRMTTALEPSLCANAITCHEIENERRAPPASASAAVSNRTTSVPSSPWPQTRRSRPARWPPSPR